VAYLFDRKGVLLVDKDGAPDEDQLLELILDAGAEDLNGDGDQWQVTTGPTALAEVRKILEAANVPIASAELTMIPQTAVPVDGSEARKLLALIEALDDLDDVQNIYANFDIPDEVLAEVG
jgi:transcriptional/translational regulatory protein YebC/TACO1